MTREEKTVVRAYIKMAHMKGWTKPSEYEMSTMINNMECDARMEMDDFINAEWKNLNKAL